MGAVDRGSVVAGCVDVLTDLIDGTACIIPRAVLSGFPRDSVRASCICVRLRGVPRTRPHPGAGFGVGRQEAADWQWRVRCLLLFKEKIKQTNT